MSRTLRNASPAEVTASLRRYADKVDKIKAGRRKTIALDFDESRKMASQVHQYKRVLQNRRAAKKAATERDNAAKRAAKAFLNASTQGSVNMEKEKKKVEQAKKQAAKLKKVAAAEKKAAAKAEKNATIAATKAEKAIAAYKAKASKKVLLPLPGRLNNGDFNNTAMNSNVNNNLKYNSNSSTRSSRRGKRDALNNNNW